MTLLLALTDHQQTLYVAIIAAVGSVGSAWLSGRNGKKVNDVHNIVERRKNGNPPELHPKRRADDQEPGG